jgi:hypothetical protein
VFSWQIAPTSSAEMISAPDNADNPERGAVRADLFLHCICREQVTTNDRSEWIKEENIHTFTVIFICTET